MIVFYMLKILKLQGKKIDTTEILQNIHLK